MEMLLLLALGIFIGWWLFRPKQDAKKGKDQTIIMDKDECSQVDEGRRTASAMQAKCASRSEKNHTLRNVAGGVAAGAILGQVLSGDKKNVNWETTNNYSCHQDVSNDVAYEENDGDEPNGVEDSFDCEDVSDNWEDDSSWNDSCEDDDDY